MRSETDDLCLTEKLFGRPLTRMGWHAVRLEVAFVAGFTLMVLWGHRARYGFDWIAGALAATTAASAMAAGVAAVLGVLRGERSLLLFLILLVGILVLLFVIGEFLETHSI